MIFLFIPIFIWALNIDKLSYSKEWLILNHYINNISYIDDKNFFLAKNGKYSPKDELIATINQINKKDIQCKYIARRDFLAKYIKFKTYRCKKFEKFYKKLNIKSISLIFPSIYLYSPASMFGHLFLRLDSNNTLLSKSISYFAITHNDKGFKYIFKGLTGKYKGYFLLQDYKDSLNNYNYLENRDIYIFKLNLSQKEIKRLIKHYYEIKNHYTNYTYIHSNCAYNILFLLSYAKNKYYNLNFQYKTIPLDVIKYLNQNQLIYSTSYYPSIATKIKFLSKNISKQKVINIINNKTKNYTQKELDLAINYMLYLHNKVKIKNFNKKYFRLLIKRTKFKKSNYNIKFDNPLNSHSSSKITISKDYIGYRFLMHNINDNLTYYKYNEIEFFNTKLYKKHLDITFFKFSLINNNSFFNYPSFGFSSGIEKYKLYLSLKYGKSLDLYNNLYYFYLNDKLSSNNNLYIINGFLIPYKQISINIEDSFNIIKIYNNLSIQLNYFLNKDRKFFINYSKKINLGISLYF